VNRKDNSGLLPDDELQERLMLVMESSLRVHNATSFFLWSQGALQMLIPHEIFIGAVSHGSGRGHILRWFSSSRYFREEHFAAACATPGGLVPRLLDEWMEKERPQFFLPGAMSAGLEMQLNTLELRNLVCHGIRGSGPQSGGFFCFARTRIDHSERSAHVLDLLAPCVYTTFCRVLNSETQGVASGTRAKGVVTVRESQILDLVKNGKTTEDIALHLSLSPNTVRNHVKNILKKLDAKSRTQAVAKAMTMGILLNVPIN